MKKILITGITGFVGKHLTEHLLEQQSFEIYGTYRTEANLGNLGDLADKLHLAQIDLHDADKVEELIVSIQPDYIFHLAAQASPSKSFAAPVETLTNNIVSEFSILNALKKNKMDRTRVMIVSTSETYGIVRPEDNPVDEDTPLRPATPYAVSKIAQDYLSLQYQLAYKLDIVRLRPFNHIGPGQKEGFVVADFAKQIVEIEKGQMDAIISVGNLDAKRDFTDVRDMVKAYGLSLEKCESGEVYNIGTGKSHKIEDILTTLLSLSEKKIEVRTDPERVRPIDVPEIRCDCTKFHALTNWQPEIELKKTLQDILDYWRKIV
ncbi:MAG TPA: GDP-mannose 4,6-dehydratase [Candidatus Saccharimonadales bacterium]|nr:GDP-mannose 4,6-dehydratase [Candidatus Saccharimonadales bacterium]